jgi:hypothetical protein
VKKVFTFFFYIAIYRGITVQPRVSPITKQTVSGKTTLSNVRYSVICNSKINIPPLYHSYANNKNKRHDEEATT